jgi:hypothetical protein
MFCKSCRYALKGLQQRRCPECGVAFDPYNRSTFARSARALPRSLRHPCLLLAMYPILTAVCCYGTWIVAASFIGHWPKPSIDDPKSINFAVDLMSAVALALALIMPLVLFVNVAALIIEGIFRIRSQRHLVWGWLDLIVISVVCWFAGFIALRIDPPHVVNWLMD